MAQPQSTRRLKKSVEDLRMMKVREEVTRLTAEMQQIPEGTKDATLLARRAALQQQIAPLRKEMMNLLGATKRLG